MYGLSSMTPLSGSSNTRNSRRIASVERGNQERRVPVDFLPGVVAERSRVVHMCVSMKGISRQI